MRSMFKTVLVAVLAVLALSAVVASAAQAEEAPFFKIAGARLAKGESREVTGKSAEIDLEFGAGRSMHCSLGWASGAKLLGSQAGQPGTAEMTMELSKCTTLANSGECTVAHEPVKSAPLLAKLVETEKGKGPLAVWFKPKTGTTFLEVEFEGKTCEFPKIKETGSYAGLIHSGGKGVEVGKEPAEAKTLEFYFSSVPFRHVWVISNGLGEEAKVGLEEPFLGEAAFNDEYEKPASLFELTSGSNWGVFV